LFVEKKGGFIENLGIGFLFLGRGIEFLLERKAYDGRIPGGEGGGNIGATGTVAPITDVIVPEDDLQGTGY